MPLFKQIQDFSKNDESILKKRFPVKNIKQVRFFEEEDIIGFAEIYNREKITPTSITIYELHEISRSRITAKNMQFLSQIDSEFSRKYSVNSVVIFGSSKHNFYNDDDENTEIDGIFPIEEDIPNNEECSTEKNLFNLKSESINLSSF